MPVLHRPFEMNVGSGHWDLCYSCYLEGILIMKPSNSITLATYIFCILGSVLFPFFQLYEELNLNQLGAQSLFIGLPIMSAIFALPYIAVLNLVKSSRSSGLAFFYLLFEVGFVIYAIYVFVGFYYYGGKGTASGDWSGVIMFLFQMTVVVFLLAVSFVSGFIQGLRDEEAE